ncbi:MAG: hypothetical protein HYY23_17170, partial [Verrucomicrobia bacterium]|nr:hypothetical protein [Verrucomicrobiota bacterium]
NPRGHPATVEGETAIAQKWLSGDTGQGRVVLWRGDLIPSQSYAEFVHDLLLETPSLRPETRAALQMDKPSTVFWSVLANGKTALLNFSNRPATVRLANGKNITISPHEMAME